MTERERDYGEPFDYEGEVPDFDNWRYCICDTNDGRVIRCATPELAERATAMFNVLAGIADPAGLVREVREVLEMVSLFYRASQSPIADRARALLAQLPPADKREGE